MLVQKGDEWYQWSSDKPYEMLLVPKEYYQLRPEPWTKSSTDPEPDERLVRFRQDMETSGNSDLDDALRASGNHPLTKLDSREWATVCLTSRGYTSDEIGTHFGISPGKVDSVLTTALRKLQRVANPPY